MQTFLFITVLALSTSVVDLFNVDEQGLVNCYIGSLFFNELVAGYTSCLRIVNLVNPSMISYRGVMNAKDIVHAGANETCETQYNMKFCTCYTNECNHLIYQALKKMKLIGRKAPMHHTGFRLPYHLIPTPRPTTTRPPTTTTVPPTTTMIPDTTTTSPMPYISPSNIPTPEKVSRIFSLFRRKFFDTKYDDNHERAGKFGCSLMCDRQ